MRYKLGKLPARPGAVKLKFTDYADTAALPAPPASFGHDKLVVGGFPMLLNDRIGDCAIAGALHQCQLWNAEAGVAIPVSDSAAVANYSAITGYQPGPELTNPNAPPNPTDQGTDVPSLLKYWYNTGIADAVGNRHQILGVTALEPGNWEQFLYASYYFDGVSVGLKLPGQWQEAFIKGKPWDKLRRLDVEGGHYVVSVAWRDGNAVLVTWGGEVEITQAGYEQASDETYALISEEKLKDGVDLEGLNVDQLAADMFKLDDISG